MGGGLTLTSTLILSSTLTLTATLVLAITPTHTPTQTGEVAGWAEQKQQQEEEDPTALGAAAGPGSCLDIARGEDAIADVAPCSGRLLLFFADRSCPHEVLPVTSDVPRVAMTLWYIGSRVGGIESSPGGAVGGGEPVREACWAEGKPSVV